LDKISKIHWNSEGKDKLIWVGNDEQEYTVKSGYIVLNREDSMQSYEVFQLLWSLKIPPSTIVCEWRILLDRLPTRVNLGRRRVQLRYVCCPLCQGGDKTTQHLRNSCRVTQKVWDHCERWVGNVTVRHEDIIIHFQSFHLMGHSNRVNSVWKGLWVAIVSEIWNHRNKVVFRGRVVDVKENFSLA